MVQTRCIGLALKEVKQEFPRVIDSDNFFMLGFRLPIHSGITLADRQTKSAASGGFEEASIAIQKKNHCLKELLHQPSRSTRPN
jgi:hypothetical protein